MMELEEHRPRDMIERQEDDVVRQIAASSAYSTRELRTMQTPRRNPQVFVFGKKRFLLDDRGIMLFSQMRNKYWTQ